MKKFTLFLVVALALTAFLAGYIMVKRGAGSADLKTGSILDRFNDQRTKVKEESGDTADAGPISVLLTDKKAISPVLSSDKLSVLYYGKDTGKLYSLKLDSGEESTVSDNSLPDLVSVFWSPTRKETIHLFNYSGEKVFKEYHLGNITGKKLDSNIQSVAFAPDGNLIAYYYFSEEGVGKVVLSQPDGTYPKTIFNARLKNVTLTWPSKDMLSLKTDTDLFSLTLDGKKLNKLVDFAIALEEKWSPSGNKLLYSVFSNDPEDPATLLWLNNLITNEVKQLEIPGSAYNCVWSIDDINVFCAIPNTASADDIYKINTVDGSYVLAAEPFMILSELILSPLEDQVIFINAVDEKLYSIKLAD